MNKCAKHDDNTLIELIKDGDIRAFEALYDRYASAIFKRCFFFCLNKDEANDLMQDIWSKVFFNINHFKQKSAFSTWLYRIATNHCINHMKKKNQSEISINNIPSEISDTDGKEASVELNNILSRLTLEDRTLLTMKYMDELTYEEISLIMGIGVSAVKMRLSRLIKKLRDEVGI
jgi:RNA polymerase sigma-70 factor (ECF subfamily)